MRIRFISLVFLMVCVLSFHGYPQKAKNINREQLEVQRQELLIEIKRTTSELTELRKNKKASLSELKALQNKLNARQQLIDNINNEIRILEDNIRMANQDVLLLKTQLDTLKKHYAELVRYTYKNRTSYDMIVFLFSSQSFNDAIRRLQYVKQYRAYRAQQATKIMSAGRQLNNKITVLNQQKQSKDVVLTAQQQQTRILEAETQEKNKVVIELKGKEKELMNDLARKKRAADQLNRAISQAIQREIELARQRALEEKREQDRLRKAAADKEKRLSAEKRAKDEAARLAEAKRIQAEKEKQALADKTRREEQERKLAQEKKDREDREKALLAERKQREEAERKASKLAEAQRVEREKQLAMERRQQEERERALLKEKKQQEERQRELLAERQRQEEVQRELQEEKKRQEREQTRLSQANPYGNPRYNQSLADKETPTPVRETKPSAPIASNTESKGASVRTVERDDYKYALTPEERALSDNFEANKGKLPWPVEKGYIAERFGKNKHPLFNVVTDNNGVDIKTSAGANARAIHSGVVNSIINIPGMGLAVLVNHGSFYTVYSKLSKVNVSKGSRVSVKQALGTVSTDEDGNTLIHFEIWKVGPNGSPFKVNPEQWVAQ